MRRTFPPRMLISRADVEVYEFEDSKINPAVREILDFCYEAWSNDKHNLELMILVKSLAVDFGKLNYLHTALFYRIRRSKREVYWLEYFWSLRLRDHCSVIPQYDKIQKWVDELGELEEQLLPYLEEHYSVLPGHVGCFWTISYVHRSSD